MDSELKYLCFFNIHNGDDPLLNFEFVKSAKFFFFSIVLFWLDAQQAAWSSG